MTNEGVQEPDGQSSTAKNVGKIRNIFPVKHMNYYIQCKVEILYQYLLTRTTS